MISRGNAFARQSASAVFPEAVGPERTRSWLSSIDGIRSKTGAVLTSPCSSIRRCRVTAVPLSFCTVLIQDRLAAEHPSEIGARELHPHGAPVRAAMGSHRAIQ